MFLEYLDTLRLDKTDSNLLQDSFNNYILENTTNLLVTEAKGVNLKLS